MVWNLTSELDNPSIRKSYVARNENSNEYYVEVFRPQMIFCVCFGYGYPYVRECYQLYCVFLHLSLCGTGALSEILEDELKMWDFDGFSRCADIYILLSLHFTQCIPKTLQKCWIVLTHHLYSMHIHVSIIHSQSNYNLLLLLFYWLHYVKAFLTNCFMTFATCKKQILHPESWKVTIASPTTDKPVYGSLYSPLLYESKGNLFFQ